MKYIAFLLAINSVILLLILKKQIKMGEKLDQMNALLDGINEDTNNIAADLERIAGNVSGGLTAAEADSVVTKLQVAADKLKAVANTNPEEEPAP